MAKGNFAKGGVAILVAFTLAESPCLADENGCAVLADRVKSVIAAAMHDQELKSAAIGADYHGRVAVAARPATRRYTCNSTAAVASRAFAEAVAGLDVRLSWNGDWLRPGDVCLSHYLSQCYPSNDPMRPLPSPREFAFVQKAWQGVAQALASQMPYGFRGDLTSFDDESLADALRAELPTGQARRLNQVNHRQATNDLPRPNRR